MQVECVAATKDVVGESPRWDHRHSRLVWVDAERPLLHSLDPRTGHVGTHRLSEPASSIALRADGGYVITDRCGVRALSWAHDDTPSVGELLMPLEAGRADCVVNDSGCDQDGRLLVGFGSESTGGLGRVESVAARSGAQPGNRQIRTGMFLPNGIGWSPDGRRLYLADSYARSVYVHSYDRRTGDLGEAQVFHRAERDEGLPDGLAVDSEGCVWVAFWGGHAVRRYSPSGELLRTVDLPVRQVSSCAFGGPGLTDLYITTAAFGLEGGVAAAGSLFRVATGAQGLPVDLVRF
ncbi:sugar lactone lactonase YvrE [Kribbella aluminosa]|uniref:Sugar lactone lactonase YvrE n=1 Tax=Kribbella aluminosa TaxID=416017 RepID=A0ABS4UIW7_9ACTN|nr:SMP-30/gluconolactonase/LRE family protein [Kribbella aluminosa]MBP2351601.1 sugar lactone lactonase YvrE [Kribbella aluminosa]